MELKEMEARARHSLVLFWLYVIMANIVESMFATVAFAALAFFPLRSIFVFAYRILKHKGEI